MIYSSFSFGKLEAIYYMENEILDFMLVPSNRKDDILPEKLDGFKNPEPMLQLTIDGDPQSVPYAQGMSMRNSGTAMKLRVNSQRVSENGGFKMVETEFSGSHGEVCTHFLSGQDNFLRSWVTVKNTSEKLFTLTNLQSFSMCNISPFEPGSAVNCLRYHKFNAFWSCEGRLESTDFEDACLEVGWSGFTAKNMLIKQVGSMPVKKNFPFLAVEDKKHGVTWAAELEWSGSWQMEVYRRSSHVSISGGLADYEEGHWCKELAPGETLTTPPAYITAVNGGIDEACDALLEAHKDNLIIVNEAERELAPMYNEYCDTWGAPTYDKVKLQLESLKDLGLSYFIIDAGWYHDSDWYDKIGDWEYSELRFPGGMKNAADLIKSYGMIPGVWFEFEVAGLKSKFPANHPDLIIKRNNHPVIAGDRLFLDMTKEDSQKYLDKRVIDFLSDNGFGYIKVDYNETCGMGFDGYESFGEGLRQGILGTHNFFDRMRRRIPGLVIEICASGGHRLEPAMLKRGSMASFSDAHETTDIPLIAADLQRLILARQSQIWATIREEDSVRRIIYSITAAMHGRLCLSGKIWALDSKRRDVIKEGVEFYKSVVHIIRDGVSRIIRNGVKSYLEPSGWQLTVRKTRNSALLVFHAFAIGDLQDISIPLTGFEDMKIKSIYAEDGTRAEWNGKTLDLKINGDFSGIAIYCYSGT